MQRAYASAILRGPAEALAAPVFIMLLDFLLRGAGPGARGALVAISMLVTFGAAWVGHLYVVRQLQKQLLPLGEPRLAKVLVRLRLGRAWLVVSATVAVVFSLIMAAIVMAIGPR